MGLSLSREYLHEWKKVGKLCRKQSFSSLLETIFFYFAEGKTSFHLVKLKNFALPSAK